MAVKVSIIDGLGRRHAYFDSYEYVYTKHRIRGMRIHSISASHFLWYENISTGIKFINNSKVVWIKSTLLIAECK